MAQTQFVIQDTLTTQVEVSFENGDDTNAVNFTITPIPNSVGFVPTTKEFSFNYANGKGIIYGMAKNAPVPAGLVMTLDYSNLDDNATVTIFDVTGANAQAQRVVVGGAQGSITLYFPYSTVVNTAHTVVGLTDDGIDMNDDGIVDAVDVQLMMNKTR